MIKKQTFDSGKSGKHVLILGAVHGNEIAGVLAQQEIIRFILEGKIKLKSGSVTFIPIVNEKAYEKDVRFIDINLNRVVQFHPNPTKYEELIANELIKEIEQADILLDLHSTHCPEDKPFAFIDYPTVENEDFLKIIPVDTALAGWPEIYKNNAQIDNNCTEEYAYRHQKLALTVECGYHKNEEAVQVARHSILNALLKFDVIEGEKPKEYTKKIIRLDSFVVKEEEGNLTKEYKHLDEVFENEPLAVYQSGKTLQAPFNGFIIMPNKEATIGAEWFYIGMEKTV